MIRIISSDAELPYQIFERPSSLDGERIAAIVLVAIGILGLAAACLAFPMMEAEAVCLALGGAGLILMAAAIASGPHHSYATYRHISHPFYYQSPDPFFPAQPVWHRRARFVDRNWSIWNRQSIPLRSRSAYLEGNRIKVGKGHVLRNDWMASPIRSHLSNPMESRVRVGSRR